MLRQVYIFQNQNQIFNHSLALALGSEDFKNVIEVVEPYMVIPTPGQTLHRSISNYQIFHRSHGTTFFLLIADLSDSFDYVDTVLKKFKRITPDTDV
ncbi:MAG: hypothetical protein ACFFAO_17030, partial [Candidatus Hermodarchaeota archaeon]